MLDRRALCSVAAALALLAVQPASARDVCIEDSGGNALKLVKVKRLRKPGAVVPLTGVLVTAGGPVPVTGTAIRLANGSIEIGIVANGWGFLSGRSSTGSFLVDAEFNGGGFVDTDGDLVQDEPFDWTAIDCDAVPFP